MNFREELRDEDNSRSLKQVIEEMMNGFNAKFVPRK